MYVHFSENLQNLWSATNSIHCFKRIGAGVGILIIDTYSRDNLSSNKVASKVEVACNIVLLLSCSQYGFSSVFSNFIHNINN